MWLPQLNVLLRGAMTDKSWVWKSDSVYCGGGKKLPKPTEQGTIGVNDDGTIWLSPDDDYYSGSLTLEQSIELAYAVLDRGLPLPPWVLEACRSNKSS